MRYVINNITTGAAIGFGRQDKVVSGSPLIGERDFSNGAFVVLMRCPASDPHSIEGWIGAVRRTL